MSEIKWEDLTEDQQALMLKFPTSGTFISFDSVLLRTLESLGVVECFRPETTPPSFGIGVCLTPTGRALVPNTTHTARAALQAENKRLKDVLRCARDWRDIDDKSMDEGIYICNRLFDAIDACNDIQLADEATETKE